MGLNVETFSWLLPSKETGCFMEAGIKIIADLVRKSEDEMLNFKNFGKKSLTEIQELLAGMGVTLGMQVDPKKIKKG